MSTNVHVSLVYVFGCRGFLVPTFAFIFFPFSPFSFLLRKGTIFLFPGFPTPIIASAIGPAISSLAVFPWLFFPFLWGFWNLYSSLSPRRGWWSRWGVAGIALVSACAFLSFLHPPSSFSVHFPWGGIGASSLGLRNEASPGIFCTFPTGEHPL